MKEKYHKKYYREHKEKYSDYQKIYIQKPEVKERRALRERKRRKNPKVKKYNDEYAKKYVKKNRKKINKYQRDYYKRRKELRKLNKK